jgi:hypothetical protein
MQKFKQGFLPSSFSNVWFTNEIRRDGALEITLRNRDDINIPFARLSSSSRQPLVNLPRLWENFRQEDIKIIRNKLEFKSKLKEYFLNNLSEIVICNRLLCHACHLNAA